MLCFFLSHWEVKHQVFSLLLKNNYFFLIVNILFVENTERHKGENLNHNASPYRQCYYHVGVWPTGHCRGAFIIFSVLFCKQCFPQNWLWMFCPSITFLNIAWLLFNLYIIYTNAFIVSGHTCHNFSRADLSNFPFSLYFGSLIPFNSIWVIPAPMTLMAA